MSINNSIFEKKIADYKKRYGQRVSDFFYWTQTYALKKKKKLIVNYITIKADGYYL